jgi:5-methylcytosine-specific restriction endonuclease McrA
METLDNSGFIRLPHYLVESFAEINSEAEIKVVLYVLYQVEKLQDIKTMVHITANEFMGATGLSDGSVRDGISKALEHGYIVCSIDASDKGRIIKKYGLKLRDGIRREPSTTENNIPHANGNHNAIVVTQTAEKHVSEEDATKVEAQRVKYQNSRAKHARLPATLTVEQWISTLEYFKWKCAYCGGKYELLEHFIPLSHGKGTTWDNCVPSCSRCNVLKQSWNPLLEWGPDLSLIKAEMEVVQEYLASL